MSNKTPHSGSNPNWIMMGGNLDEIMRNSLDRAIDGDNWCEVLQHFYKIT